MHGEIGVVVGGTTVVGGVVGVVGVAVLGPQFTVQRGSSASLRFLKVMVWPFGVWPLTETGLTGLKPGEDALTGFSLTT